MLKALRPLSKALFCCLWGLFCCLLSMTLTDSPPSNWCLYIVSYCLIALAEYALVASNLISGADSESESDVETESESEALK